MRWKLIYIWYFRDFFIQENSHWLYSTGTCFVVLRVIGFVYHFITISIRKILFGVGSRTSSPLAWPYAPLLIMGKRMISVSYILDMLCRCYLGVELLSEGSESNLKTLWHHSDAVMCCSLKVFFPYFFFFSHLNPENLLRTLPVLKVCIIFFRIISELFLSQKVINFSIIIKAFFMSEHVANLHRVMVQNSTRIWPWGFHYIQ